MGKKERTRERKRERETITVKRKMGGDYTCVNKKMTH